ncbi:MAG: BON domain-containing protein, partial [Actinomycetota bacterium]|nr:BON domain-containing protein [Actinomycetota bacterium]
MPGPADSLSPGETLVRRTKTTTYPTRGGLLPWLVGFVVIPALIALLVSLAPFGERDAVQDDLAGKSRAALAAAGVSNAEVRMDGVVAQVDNVPAGQVDTARDAVRSVDGVWSANVTGVRGDENGQTPPPSTSDSAPSPAGPVGFDLKDGTITLTGTVPDEGARTALVAAATENAGGKPVDDQLTVRPGATLPADPARIGAA